MDSLGFEAVTWVPDRGFRWEQVDGQDGWTLALASSDSEGLMRVLPEYPMEERGLYSRLADLAEYEGERFTLNPRRTLDFANEYGPLFSPLIEALDMERDLQRKSSYFDRVTGRDLQESGREGSMQINPDTLESLRLPHETRTSWAEEVFAMREAVDLSSAIDEGEETLSDFIEWRDGDPYCTRHHAPGKASDQVGVPTPKGIVSTDFQDSLSAGDTQRAALIHLSRLINDHLEKQVSPTVSPQSLQFSLPLQNLRGILWVQLARFVSELDGAAEWRQCLCCPRRIPIHPVHGKRPDTKTCSDRCRKRKERGNY